jgi:hypothetical protein
MIIFVSHPYANDPKGNKKKADEICKYLLKQGHLPLSPLHLFSFMENDTRRNEIMRICFELIQIADEVWIFGDSEGCQEEKSYAEFIGKPVKIMYDKPEYRKLLEG